MNHLQLFRYVQENTDLFDFEVRSLMRTINNDLNLDKMKDELLLLLKFVELKMEDENKYIDNNYIDNIQKLLLSSYEKYHE